MECLVCVGPYAGRTAIQRRWPLPKVTRKGNSVGTVCNLGKEANDGSEDENFACN